MKLYLDVMPKLYQYCERTHLGYAYYVDNDELEHRRFNATRASTGHVAVEGIW